MQVLYAVDDAHPARPDPRLNAVAPVDHTAQPRIRGGVGLCGVRDGQGPAAVATET
jgi:hypothetical protein